MRILIVALIALVLVAPVLVPPAHAAHHRATACRHTPGMVCFPNPDPGAGLGTFICAPRRAPAAKAPKP